LVPQISSYRAEMIARTETHGAANYGSQEAAKQTGLPLAREWLAAADDRTRETHREANGQVVGMDDTFRVGDSDLAFPGDPSGPGEEVINCRCAVGYIVDDAALEAML
jgi:SPP1 gp7 family putative phage head morphogenesis protein